MSISPCMRCIRVADPEMCEDKSCRLWRQWFLQRWEELRAAPRMEMERRPVQPEGVQIGPQIYALPHRVRAYLEKDPCSGCLCPRDLCVIPCRVKRSWLQAKKKQEEAYGS